MAYNNTAPGAARLIIEAPDLHRVCRADLLLQGTGRRCVTVTDMHPRRADSLARDLINETESLRRQYEGGDAVALLECIALWKREGIPWLSLPAWALDAWLNIGAEHYEQHAHTSLDQTAGLRNNSWKSRNKLLKNDTVLAYFDAVIDRAHKARDNGTELEYTSLLSGETAPILNKRGEPTVEFQNLVAEDFRLGIGWGDNRNRTLQRAIKSARSRTK